MATIQENALPSKSSIVAADKLRAIGSDSKSYQALVSDVAKYIVENYDGSTLAGSAQSVQSALASLNSNIDITVTLISNNNYTLSVQGEHCKRGSCVTLNIAIAQSAQSSSYIKIASIPSVYAPNGWIYMTVGTSNAMVGLAPTGEIYARGNFSRSEYINLTYASK